MAASEPSELIPPPRASWAPALVVLGLAALVMGLFTWWPYAVIGAAVLLLAKISWLRRANAELNSLPRRQPLSTAPIPLQRNS